MPTQKPTKKPQVHRDNIPALLDQIAQHGWQGFCRQHTTDEATTIPCRICAWVTEQMNAACPLAELAPLSEKDRLFDLLFARLEAMAPHAKAFSILAESVRRSPTLAWPFYQAQTTAMRTVLTRAGLPKNAINTHVLLGLYHRAFLTWTGAKENAADSAMAHLDQSLTKAYPLFKTNRA